MKTSPSIWEREEWLKPPGLLIVGGGIVGASAALFYKQQFPEKEVILVDKGITPEGASTRNAGFACIGSVSEHLADIKISGEAMVLNRIKRRWNGLQLLRKTIGDDRLDYHQTGGVEIFTEAETFEGCRAKIGDLNSMLYKTIGEEDVYSTREYQGYPAIYNRLEGSINCGRLMKELHRRISALGVRTLWNSKVDFVAANSVIFEDGFEIRPETIVLAVNGFLSHLVGSSVRPARGYVFVTKPIDTLPWEGTFHYNEGYVYFRNVGNRLLLGGGRNIAVEEETTAAFGVNPAVKNYLVRFANNVLKLPKGWEIEMEWSGIMGMTSDKEPLAGEIKSGIWAAAGLSGMGISIGMQVAKELVEQMADVS